MKVKSKAAVSCKTPAANDNSNHFYDTDTGREGQDVLCEYLSKALPAIKKLYRLVENAQRFERQTVERKPCFCVKRKIQNQLLGLVGDVSTYLFLDKRK